MAILNNLWQTKAAESLPRLNDFLEPIQDCYKNLRPQKNLALIKKSFSDKKG